jgi:serine/threonine-protein kinase HipA
MADRLEVCLHGQPVGWIARGSRRERIEFEWAHEYAPGPVTLTESFGSVRSKAPTAAASSFFGGYALEGRQRQYLVIERYDRVVHGETVALIHQEDAAQALGLGWVDEHAKFQNPDAPRDSRRPSAYRIAELLGSLQGAGRPVADFLRRLTFTALLGDNDAHAKNVGILHLPGRSVLADVYDAVPNLFQQDRINYDLALAFDRSFDHRRISAGHLIREAERWNALGASEAERIVTATLADFATALDHVAVPQGVPAVAAAQLAWNVERLQSGAEIGERPSGCRRRRR